MTNSPDMRTLQAVYNANRDTMRGVSDDDARELGYEFDPDAVRDQIDRGHLGLPEFGATALTGAIPDLPAAYRAVRATLPTSPDVTPADYVSAAAYVQNRQDILG